LEVTVSARHTEVSEALRQSATEKIGRLSRFLDGMERGEVHFSEERNPRIADKEVCEVVLEAHGQVVRCKVAAPDGFTAVDKAVAKLEHQLHKLKTKQQRRQLGGRAKVGAGDEATSVAVEVPAEAVEGPKIVKVKRHELKPMTVDEATLQLDLIGHDFYFFANADTGRAAVLYRRADGDLGLIDEAD
jgi:putative sigma-54 modulation protein